MMHSSIIHFFGLVPSVIIVNANAEAAELPTLKHDSDQTSSAVAAMGLGRKGSPLEIGRAHV